MYELIYRAKDSWVKNCILQSALVINNSSALCESLILKYYATQFYKHTIANNEYISKIDPDGLSKFIYLLIHE